MKTLFEWGFFILVIAHVLCWIAFVSNYYISERFRSEVLAKTPQPEIHLIKWDNYPKLVNSEKLNTIIVKYLLYTGVPLIVLAFLAYASDAPSSCADRFQDYC